MSSHCGVHQLDFGSLHGQQGENLTGWETTKGGARWWHGGALIQSFHHQKKQRYFSFMRMFMLHWDLQNGVIQDR